MDVRRLVRIDLSALPRERAHEENDRLQALAAGIPADDFFIWLGRPQQ